VDFVLPARGSEKINSTRSSGPGHARPLYRDAKHRTIPPIVRDAFPPMCRGFNSGPEARIEVGERTAGVTVMAKQAVGPFDTAAGGQEAPTSSLNGERQRLPHHRQE